MTESMMTRAPLFSAFIPGKTPGKARPRYDSRNKRHHMPQAYLNWMDTAAVRLVCLGTHYGGYFPGAIATPVAVTVEVILPAPKSKPAKTSSARRMLWKPRKSHPSEPFPWIGKPDIDNAAGSVLDALVKARVLLDDTLVSSLSVKLMASHDPAQVGARVVVLDYLRQRR